MAGTTIVRYGATVLLNADTDWRWYRYDNRLYYDHRTLLDISERTIEDALDRAFRIGNRREADDTGTHWSADVRSVSVGDVIYVSRLVVRDGELVTSSEEGYWSVDRFGFTRLTRDPVAEYSTEAMVAAGLAAEVAS